MTLELPESLRPYLDVLVKTGLYGTTPEACAERLIADAIEDKMRGPMANLMARALERR